ncbi:disintegrin and metalloproteinase domain-containing protein 8-like isoform X2 [Protopterus annectens]|uniref:disintegrin and metalloproteinase domain-containing protein 8-like isoform X2 n=1 Tax=Protopterus annectens TaxID=7888 RepID=UPI001CF94FAD|nr:disintegrin and metalloproteinase domain-containing protein 8-like isoform X2 [Protopterus annectens]
MYWALYTSILTLSIYSPISVLCSAAFMQLSDVEKYEVTKPIRGSRSLKKRDLSSNENAYPKEVRYDIGIEGKNHTIHLKKNQDLLGTNYTETYYLDDGTEVTHAPKIQDHCYYHGHIKGIKDSSVSISTCAGIRGSVYFDEKTYLIEPLEGTDEGEHAIYRQEHLRMKRGTCGNSNNTIYDKGPRLPEAVYRPPLEMKPSPLIREKQYVELYLVVDNSEYVKLGKDMEEIRSRMMSIVNHVDKLYRTINFRVALVGMEVWTSGDLIYVSTVPNITLKNFLTWRKENLKKKKPHDNAQLITAVNFEGSTVGLATKFAMCEGDSGAVNEDHSKKYFGVASTLAHEMGHNLGMSHDDEVPGCWCEKTQLDGGCVMAPSVGDKYPSVFSSCSKNDLATFLQNSKPSCLAAVNTDDLYGGPVCGNMFLEHGEECDCGTLQECTNLCCNASTCKLHEDSECAQGECCQDCKLKPAGILCRQSKDDCDLPEYCTGAKAVCPVDAFQQNGSPCKKGRGHCYNGQCPTHAQHCITLWGPDAKVAPHDCFRLNKNGGEYHYCRKYQQQYVPCESEDVLCGKIYCTGGTNFPITQRKYITSFPGIKEGCKVAGIKQDIATGVDFGLVPTGTKCGNDKVCYEGRCQELSVYGSRNCSDKCNNRGVCNHQNECHCDAEWAPPYCSRRYSDGVESGGLMIAVIVAVVILLLILAVLAGGVFLKQQKSKTNQLPEEIKVTSESSGLLNPLFLDTNSKQAQKISHISISGPVHCTTTVANWQNCTPINSTASPSRQAPPALRPNMPPPVPPGKPVSTECEPVHIQVIPHPPTKPLPELKVKQIGKVTPAPVLLPPLKPTSAKPPSSQPQIALMPKIALKPVVHPKQPVNPRC